MLNVISVVVDCCVTVLFVFVVLWLLFFVRVIYCCCLFLLCVVVCCCFVLFFCCCFFVSLFCFFILFCFFFFLFFVCFCVCLRVRVCDGGWGEGGRGGVYYLYFGNLFGRKGCIQGRCKWVEQQCPGYVPKWTPKTTIGSGPLTVACPWAPEGLATPVGVCLLGSLYRFISLNKNT